MLTFATFVLDRSWWQKLAASRVGHQQICKACVIDQTAFPMMLPPALAAPAEERRFQDPHRPPRRSLPLRVTPSGVNWVAFIVWTEVMSVYNSDQRLVVHEAWRSSYQNMCACDESHLSRTWILITRVVSMSHTGITTETEREWSSVTQATNHGLDTRARREILKTRRAKRGCLSAERCRCRWPSGPSRVSVCGTSLHNPRWYCSSDRPQEVDDTHEFPFDTFF